MTLEAGSKLGPYEIVALIGAGGMGEVYRAHDPRVGRDVAIKISTERFSERFEREIHAVAALNHSNICTLYDVGPNFLVMELVEGPTLADRIKQGPIPLEESLEIARQIADALEAAHEKGIVHRDLKPGNIKVRPDGTVKVLDFGLAKVAEATPSATADSPTLSVLATQQGVILGTAAYMSPEQARGKAVDKRTDIWAFGCVLYEMLTGQAAFQGEDVTEILASVVKGGANLDLLPANTHPRVREIISHCLQKDLKKRYQDVGDVRFDIEQIVADPSAVLAPPITGAEPRRKLRTILPWAAATLVLGLIIAGVAVWNLKKPESRRVMRFDYELPQGQQFITMQYPVLAVSPNGKQFAYSTSKGLYLRSVDEFTAKLIAGTEGDTLEPFFSPDGEWIGYFSVAEQKLKKIIVNGGVPVTLCDFAQALGAIWNEDNTIIYSQNSEIMRISANGGTPDSIVKRKSGPLSTPQVLPGGKAVLYTVPISIFQGKVTVQSIKSGEPKELFVAAAYGARYVPTGHIVYSLGTNLFAVPFDPDRLEVTGGPVPLIEDVRQAAISDSGVLIYLPGSINEARPPVTLVWVNREGKEEPLPAPPNDYGVDDSSPKISPDGTRVALTFSTGGRTNIWIWDLIHENMNRLTFDEGENGWPLWTPDGKWIVYRLSRDGIHYDINRRAADGSGDVEKLGSLPNHPGPFCWSKDAKTFLLDDLILSPFHEEIGIVSLEGGLTRKLLLPEKSNNNHPQISPDGRWLAYASNESSRNEVYVRPFPAVNKGRWQVSANGGNGPLWSPNGRELYYRNGESVVAVSVETEPTFKYGKPRELFRGTYFSINVGQSVLPMWDISPDGKRFLMMKEAASTGKPAAPEGSRKISIVLNWFEELKQRVPAK